MGWVERGSQRVKRLYETHCAESTLMQRRVNVLCPLTAGCITSYKFNFLTTVKILCIGTDRPQQTVQTKIRLLLKKQSDQGLRCLPLHQLLLDALMQCYIKLYQF